MNPPRGIEYRLRRLRQRMGMLEEHEAGGNITPEGKAVLEEVRGWEHEVRAQTGYLERKIQGAIETLGGGRKLHGKKS